MRVQEEKEEGAEIQMGPMIDCVFLLLMYFIAAAQIKPEEKYLGLMMPGGGAPKESLPAEVTLGILENNQVTFNETPMDSTTGRDLPVLQAKLKEALSLFGEKQPVVIHPMPSTKHQRVVDVLNACAGAGVKNLSFFANQQ